MLNKTNRPIIHNTENTLNAYNMRNIMLSDILIEDNIVCNATYDNTK